MSARAFIVNTSPFLSGSVLDEGTDASPIAITAVKRGENDVAALLGVGSDGLVEYRSYYIKNCLFVLFWDHDWAFEITRRLDTDRGCVEVPAHFVIVWQDLPEDDPIELIRARLK